MKVLVTGTAGFIGSAVAIKLLERGDEVIGLGSRGLWSCTVSTIPSEKQLT